MVKTRETGGFLSKNAHMNITKGLDGITTELAEVGFEADRTSTKVLYKNRKPTQIMKIKSAVDQKQNCTIGGERHTWAPLGPSQKVLEFSDSVGRRVAIFVYLEEVSNLAKNQESHGKKSQWDEIGQLHIFGRDDQSVIVDKIIGSALAVIERNKRWTADVQDSRYLAQAAGMGTAGTAADGRS